MKNPIELVKELGFDLAFLPNDYNASCIYILQKRIEIGTEAQRKAYFDFPFLCLAHEVGHALDEDISNEHPVLGEIKAWKTAFKEFLTEQPEIRLKMLAEAQLRLNRYVQKRIFGEEVDDVEIDEVW